MSTVIDAIRHKTFDLKIEVENKEIVLMGYPAEAAGKVLRGKVILTLEEPMKLRAVTLNFVGRMKVAWSEGIGHHQHYHKQEKDILEHKWQFVPVMDQHPKKSYTLNQGRHEWDFELSLPGTLPQTLEAEGGQITYRLKAVVERSVLLQNIVKKQPIRIVRCLLPSAFDLAQSLEIHNTWTEKMMYDILLPSKLYTRGQLIPVTFHITPIAAGLRVRSLTASLKEYCTYSAHDCSKTDTRIIKLHKDEDPFPNVPLRITSSSSSNNNNNNGQQNRHSNTSSNSGQSEAVNDGGPISWSKVIQLDIPPMSSQAAFCDADNDLIRIRHKMKFVICLANADGHLSELRCSVPIIIVSSVSSENEAELSTSLPAYDQSWRTVLCMEGPPAQQQPQEQSETTVSNGTLEHAPQIQHISRPQSGLSSSSTTGQQQQQEQLHARRTENERWTSNNNNAISSSNIISNSGSTTAAAASHRNSSIPNSLTPSAPIPANIPIVTTIAAGASQPSITRNVSSTNVSMSPTPPTSTTSPTLSSSPAPSVWWHGTNLSRVPSYRTAAQQEQATFSTSLPTYEQITSALQAMATSTTSTTTATNNTSSNGNSNNNSGREDAAFTHTTMATATVPATSNHMADNDIIYKRD